jgi:CRP/FNR family transcriptional regulator, cyclic AMP receptor protein
MEQQQLRHLLERLAFSADLPVDVLSELAAVSLLQRFAAGEVLFREGSQSQVLYLVAAGRVALDMDVPGRGQTRVLSLGPGDMLGWSALIGQGLMTTSAVTLDDCELIAISGTKLVEICDRNPEIGYPLMRRTAVALSKRLLATRLQLLDLFGDGSKNQ